MAKDNLYAKREPQNSTDHRIIPLKVGKTLWGV